MALYLELVLLQSRDQHFVYIALDLRNLLCNDRIYFAILPLPILTSSFIVTITGSCREGPAIDGSLFSISGNDGIYCKHDMKLIK